MNTWLILLFVLCVLGFSVTVNFSVGSQTYFRNRDKRIQNWNFILLGFAIFLASFIRFPVVPSTSLGAWFVNFLICLGIGVFIFTLVLIISLAYRYRRNETCL